MKNKQVIIYPVPWDITTTFHHGTAQGPVQIQSVLHQLDDVHPFSLTTNELKFEPASQRINDLQSIYSDTSRSIIDISNQGKDLTEDHQRILKDINKANSEMNHIVYLDCLKLLKKGPVILCGGEHGVGVGYIHALADQYDSFGVLQIDAHMDCRISYFGYEYSHASVITHYSSVESVDIITQVGIRDYDASEIHYQAISDTQFFVFRDFDMHQRLFEGATWAMICKDIIESLPDKVFISFDIDGLCPYLCSGTGTPVPGGLSYNQVLYLLKQLMDNKSVIGAELVEVSNDYSDWNAIVGARLLSVLSGLF